MIKKSEQTYFPGQQKEEKVFLLIRKHWFNYIIFFVLFVLMIIPLVVLAFFWIGNPAFFTPLIANAFVVGLSIYLLVLLGLLLFGFVSFYLDVYIVTNRRIVDIKQNGFFNREISELHLQQVQDVNARVRGFFQTVLHFGNVYVQTAAERENFTFESIPHPYTIAKQVIDLHERYLSEGGDTLSRQFPSQDYENSMPYDNLESEAKGLLKESTLNERLRNPGIFHSEALPETMKAEIKKKIAHQKSPRKVMMKNAKEEGELKEGQEVDLE